jgi:hypothetical protein
MIDRALTNVFFSVSKGETSPKVDNEINDFGKKTNQGKLYTNIHKLDV